MNLSIKQLNVWGLTIKGNVNKYTRRQINRSLMIMAAGMFRITNGHQYEVTKGKLIRSHKKKS